MATSTNEVVIKITAEDDATAILKRIGVALDGVGDSGEGSGKKTGKFKTAFKDLGTQFKNFINPTTAIVAGIGGIGAGLVGIAKFSFNAAREMETLTAQLKIAEGSSAAADKRMAELVQTGKEIAGLDLKGLIQFNSQLKNARLNSEQTDVVMESVSKAMVEVGSTSADTARVLTQVTQAFAGNRIAAEDLKTLFADVGKATTAMQNVFGKAATGVTEFRDISERLGLTAKQSLLLVFEELNRITEVDVNTTNAQWEIFTENLQGLGATIGKPINEAVKETLKALNFLAEKTQGFFDWIGSESRKAADEQKLIDIEANAGKLERQKALEAELEKLRQEAKELIIQRVQEISAAEIAASAETLEAIKEHYRENDELNKQLFENQREQSRVTAEARIAEINAEIEIQQKRHEAMQAEDERIKNATSARSSWHQRAVERIEKREEEHNTWLAEKNKELTDLQKTTAEERDSIDEQESAAKIARDKSETEAKETFLNKQVADATTAYGKLEDAGNANKDTLISQSQAIYDNEVALNTETIKDKNELYEANKISAEAHIGRLNEIHGQEVSNAKAAYDLIKEDDKTTKAEIEAHSQSVYDKQVALNNATITNQTALNLANERAAKDHTDRINKFSEDRAKKEEDEAKKAAKAQKKFHDDLAVWNKSRADQTKIELDRITGDETSTLQERINKNNQYYGFLAAEAANRETDEGKKADAIKLINEKRLDAQTTIEEDFAKEQDDRLKKEIEAQEDAKKEAEERAKELNETRIGELNHLEEVQLGVIADLDAADDTSVEDRIAATKKLYGIRLAKLNENKEDNKNWAADKQKLENELKDDIKEILDEDQKNKEDAEKAKRDAEKKSEAETKRIAKERLEIEQSTYDDVVDTAESSADDINQAAQDLYDAKLAWIEANVEDEKEAARQILQAQKQLDADRITSVELFFKKNKEYLEAGVDIAIDAAKRELDVRRAQATAERDIKQDMLKAESDFQVDRSVIIAKYSGLMVEARAQAAPQIQAARDRGDETEANRLQAELDQLIGMTANGQLILDEFGNMQGLAKQQSDALQEITDVLNGASRDYFAELRNIEDEAKKQRARGFWDTIGQVADFGLEKAGEGIGALLGSPQAGKFIGDVAGDLAQLGTTKLGDIAVDKITDAQLRRQISEYRTQAFRAAENEARNIDHGALKDLFEGTDFDPDVIAERQAEAEAAIARRAQELYDEEVRKLNRLTDAKKRNYDKARDDESKSIDQIKGMYEDYYDRRKLLLQLTVKDEGELNDAIIRLSWERTDEREAIDQLFADRAEARRKEQEKNEEKTAEKTIETDKKVTETVIDNSDKVTETKKSNADDEVDAMKASYETQVQLNTELTKQLEEALNQQVADTSFAGFSILDIVRAINAGKTAANQESVESTKAALDTQVTDTSTAGINILHVVGAINAAKAAFTQEEVDTTKEGLDKQEEDTKKSGINILDIVAALNAQKEALSQTNLTNEMEQYKVHYDGLKALDLDWRQHLARHEGFTGLWIKTRLDNTLDDYRDHFDKLKEMADDAYDHISRRSSSSGSYISRSGGGGSSRGSRTRQALAKKRQKPEPMVVEMYADYGDGHQKKMGQGIAQQKKDRRVTPNV